MTKKKKKKEPEDVFLSAGDLEQLRSDVELRTQVIKCPELNEVMGIKEGDNIAFSIIQCDLSSYLGMQAKKNRQLDTLATGLMQALQKNAEGEVADLLGKYFGGGEGMSPQAEYEIDLCLKSVTNPKLKRSDWIWLSETFPFTVNKIANAIMALTVKGGVKKT